MQQQRAMAETLKQLEDTTEVHVQSDVAAARMALANAEQVMSQENAKELRRIVDLHHRTFAAREAMYEDTFKVHSQALDQYQHLQKYHECGVKEVCIERAELAARAAAIEAANGNREQDRQLQPRLMCAVSERGLEETYSETFTKMREERNSLTQQI